MSIKTSIPVILDIDGKDHRIILRDPSLQEKADIEALASKHSAKIDELQTLMYEVEMLRREFKMNGAMLNDPAVTDKLSIMKENKILNRDIHNKSKEYLLLSKDIDALTDEAESAYRLRFDLLVSGVDKAEVKRVIEKSGLRFSTLFKHIEEAAVAEREKKSPTSSATSIPKEETTGSSPLS